MEKFNTAWRRLRRGNVSARAIALETRRRIRVALARRGERASLTALNEKPAQLTEHFTRLSASDLLDHFRSRTSPGFFPGFASAEQTAALQTKLFPEETAELLEDARRILSHSTSLIGSSPRGCGLAEADWHSDPLTGKQWPLSFHSDIQLVRNDGSDVRLIWELNRLGHLITLGRAFALTKDEDFSKEFFLELTSWQAQNPVGRGVNWSCAMEVALRAMNLLGAFALFVQSSGLKEGELRQLLQIFDQHGAHIKRNLEFSYFGTSNHYLSDVVGLLWLGVMLPELEAAKEWRDWAFREMLREMDTQVLPDGGHYECATGYHRFVLELFLYSFLLCRLNAIEIEEKYWQKLHGMLAYLRAYLRPDGRAPLIGDSDSGRVLPIAYRAGDEHAYLLPIGALVFNEPDLKLHGPPQELLGLRTPDAPLLEELIWIFGEPGVAKYQVLKQGAVKGSGAFPNVGTYVLGDDDVYLLLNASEVGMNGRGSHRHNDALSVEVSAYGSALVVDPGTYLYSADLHQRHLFRSTAAHSTVQIDDYEQRAIREAEPFVISDKGKTVVLSFSTTDEKCEVVGQFYYDTLPAFHRRTVIFERRERQWVISDEVGCSGKHTVHFRFHFGPNVEVAITPDGVVEARDVLNFARLSIVMEGLESQPALESRFSSRDYGRKEPSTAVCWSEAVMGSTTTKVVRAKFTLRPVSHESNAA